MGNYSIIIDGQRYELTDYTEALEQRIQDEQKKMHADIPISEKRRIQKNFIRDVVRDEGIIDKIASGKADPNFTNRVYCLAVKAYVEPAEQFEADNMRQKLENSGLDKLIELMNSAGNAEKLQKLLTNK